MKRQKWEKFELLIRELANLLYKPESFGAKLEELFDFLSGEVGSNPAVSGTLFFKNSRGEYLMDVQVHVNDAPLKAVLVEFDGPNGTGNIVPGTGPTSYTSSDPTIATIDPSSGNLVYLKAGVTTITGLNSGNGQTASGVLTVISGVAQSAVLQFQAQTPAVAK
jgi:hypothetical protein